MDRRIKKTKRAIKLGLLALIEEMDYQSITIQQILDKADVGRATFYVHFKSKDEIVNSICDSIFKHITSRSLEKEDYHDFSTYNDFLHTLTHMLCHFKEDKKTLKIILSSSAHDIFLDDLIDHIKEFIKNLSLDLIKQSNLPTTLVLNQLIASLVELTSWWIKDNNCTIEPLEMAKNYLYINSNLLNI